mmetsp:Transcript_11838/g.23489  ORF Transcript_11838/g.23489 Transcript_11838/m.23489 type:complete len:227 (+) Transcript_11838:334-1014(+)
MVLWSAAHGPKLRTEECRRCLYVLTLTRLSHGVRSAEGGDRVGRGAEEARGRKRCVLPAAREIHDEEEGFSLLHPLCHVFLRWVWPRGSCLSQVSLLACSAYRPLGDGIGSASDWCYLEYSLRLELLEYVSHHGLYCYFGGGGWSAPCQIGWDFVVMSALRSTLNKDATTSVSASRSLSLPLLFYIFLTSPPSAAPSMPPPWHPVIAARPPLRASSGVTGCAGISP